MNKNLMASPYEVLPLHEWIEGVTAESDLEDVYNTERDLLYVACTRAQDFLLISGVDPASEFLFKSSDDLNHQSSTLHLSMSQRRNPQDGNL